jgi:hypothetical protein
MSELMTDLSAIALSEQVLARQGEHCRATADYLTTRGSISGSTGLILAGLGPVSDAIVQLGTAGLRTAGSMCDATAGAARSTADSYRQADESAADRMARLASGLASGWSGVPGSGTAGAPVLGAPLQSAPAGWGDSDSWFWEKAQSAGESVGDLVRDSLSLTDRVTDWGAPTGTVGEAVAAQSYLVDPTAGENWAQDMRWSAGLVLGGVDWVFEQLCGYSVLEEVIYKPFAGDAREVTKAAGAWTSSGAALSAIGLNHAALVSATAEPWRGMAGDAFRTAMGVIAEGFHLLSGVCDSVASALGVVTTGMAGICAAIGQGLKKLAQMLIEIAAEASVPGIGWGVLLATAYWKVERIVGTVRLVYTLIETAFTLIAAFAEAKVAAFDGFARFEDLAEGVFRRAGQAVAP